jgi:hypothetical protein
MSAQNKQHVCTEQAVWTFSMDMQHGPATWTISMDKQQEHAVWACSKDMKYRHATQTYIMDKQHVHARSPLQARHYLNPPIIVF